jgi:isoamylase
MSKNISILSGTPRPLGLSISGKVANFAVFSSKATQVYLGLFQPDGKLLEEIAMQKSDDIWHIAILDLPLGLEYAFRCEGPNKLLFNPTNWLYDPYAKIPTPKRAKAALPSSFDWQDDLPPNIAKKDLIIYEMHVRGFTRDPSSETASPGTYLGFIEKIPFLKKLGINAVELMPIFDSDEMHTKTTLPNYWNYNPYHFFAPKKSYAQTDPVDEFKTLVRELHKAGIEVILDVVYNHTGEGKDKSFAVCFRGLDNHAYYMVDACGHYLNFSGCDNTINCNHPMVKEWILDSLRYWIEEMHVDGFRFDLASVLTRDEKGNVLEPSPLLQAIAGDPIINKKKLIAESWDASGLYQVGEFPKWGPWTEWNDRYRDTVRKFFRGDNGCAGAFANVLTGSEMVYRSFSPLNSINFITAHDGFTLRDLVSYNEKHNLANLEENKDGSDSNNSYNWGFEGATDNAAISSLRERQMRNFLITLFVSQGIPMLVMGDVYGHSSLGNNNPYCQDNRISWFLWDQLEANHKIFQFVCDLIAFRKENPQLTKDSFLKDSDIEWHSPNWNEDSHFVSCTYKGDHPIFLAFNANNHEVQITLPQGNWQLVVNTEEDWKFHKQKNSLPQSITLSAHSCVIARI